MRARSGSTAALAADYTPEPVVTASNFYLRGDLGWSWLETQNNNDSVFELGGGVGYRFKEQ